MRLFYLTTDGMHVSFCAQTEVGQIVNGDNL